MIISGKKLVIKALLIFFGINFVYFLVEILIFKMTFDQWLTNLGGATLYFRAIIAMVVGLYLLRKEESKKEEQRERYF